MANNDNFMRNKYNNNEKNRFGNDKERTNSDNSLARFDGKNSDTLDDDNGKIYPDHKKVNILSQDNFLTFNSNDNKISDLSNEDLKKQLFPPKDFLTKGEKFITKSNFLKESSKEKALVVATPSFTSPSLIESEVDEEFSRLRFFAALPFICILSVSAFIGALLDLCIGYPSKFASQTIKYYSQCPNSSFKVFFNIIGIIFHLCGQWCSILGIELRDCSIRTLNFWLDYWNKSTKSKHTASKSVKRIKDAFNHLCTVERPCQNDRIR